MREALGLARHGAFRVEPNPCVGAVVLASDGSTVGRGFHAAYAGAHAEPLALAAAGERARGGTLVVTLEPCAHTAKKTPPCTDAILRSGVMRVAFGAADSNPDTRGRAAPLLRAAGIEVIEGPLSPECVAALSRYAAHVSSTVPWTIAKWAMTLDGRIADANGSARWISGLDARRLVHDVRARVEAVVVGRGTAARDDPSLTARDAEIPRGRRPACRVVFDSRIQVATTLGLVRTSGTVPTIVVCTEGAHHGRRAIIESHGVQVLAVADDGSGRVDIRAGFEALRALGVRRALLEAGGTLTAAALKAGVVQQVMAFVAPVVVGGERAPGPFAAPGWDMEQAPHLEEPRVGAAGQDAIVEGYWPRTLPGVLALVPKTHRVE